MSIAVSTFVRKLVRDLQDDIAKDVALSDEDKKRVSVATLHRQARSIVEQNHGSSTLPLNPHCRIVAPTWESMVWVDAVSLRDDLDPIDVPWETLQEDLYDGNEPSDPRWQAARAEHLRVEQFYNALDFATLILVAARAVEENPALVQNTLYIFDEFQDFNRAEESLIRSVSNDSPGLMLAGDDDQVLYDTLRRGMADIIRSYYHGDEFVTAMLPYCSRCSGHICLAAAHFLVSDRDAECINKLFLPLKIEPTDSKVRVIAATTPKVGVQLIATFLDEHEEQIKQREAELEAGTEKDPYLLILTPSRAMGFLTGGMAEKLLDVIASRTQAAHEPGPDYRKLHDYYDAATHPEQNFAVRKVMAHEGVSQDVITRLLRSCLDEHRSFVELGDETVTRCLEVAVQAKNLVDNISDYASVVVELRKIVSVGDIERLAHDLEVRPLNGRGTDDYVEGPTLEQAGSSNAVELTTIVGSKGLSADHVIVLGCDNTNLAYTTRNAFFVAMTRARRSLTLLACLGGGGATGLCEFVRTLPDEHVEALYAKANEIVLYPSIEALQQQLERVAYAKTHSRRKK